MAKAKTPHFHNDSGLSSISIGVKEFMCVGAKPPNDHPHIYLHLGDDIEKICPYCSTLYKFDETLSSTETSPPGYMLLDENA